MADNNDLTGAAIGAGRAVFKLGTVVVRKAGSAIATAMAEQPERTQPWDRSSQRWERDASRRPVITTLGSDADRTLVEQALRSATDDQLVTELARRLAESS